jgi:MerR family mercuric resistance operon transcriptional regulator
MSPATLTIGRLARAAGVGIETIRYYQRRELLPVPDPADSAFRHYPAAMVDRIRFIKRAQDLGFSLDEIAALLKLEDGANRKAIRKLANDRLGEIREKISDLQRMEKTLAHLIHECEHGGALHCPIIQALAENGDSALRPSTHTKPSGIPH